MEQENVQEVRSLLLLWIVSSKSKTDNIEYIIFNIEASMLKVANTFRLFKYELQGQIQEG